MGNTILTPQVIARESLMVLVNNLVMANLVYRNYSDDFQKVGDTVTIRKPATFTANEFTGASITVQDAKEEGVPIKLDRHMDVSFNVTSAEMTLSIQDFSEQFIQPAMRAHAQALDSYLCSKYKQIPYYVKVSADPAIDDFAAIDEMMNINKVPVDQRYGVVGPTTKAKYVVLDAVMHAEKSGSTDALRNASLGRLMTVDSYMDQNVVSHVTGDLAATATLTGLAGAKTGTVAVGGNAKTIKEGDIFTIATLTGYQFVCTEEMTTDAEGAGTLKFYPALPSAVNGQVITAEASHKANLAFHKNCIGLVTRPLYTPLGASKVEVMSYNGISVRVVYGYDLQTKSDTISLDCLYGATVLTPELGVRLVD